MVLAFLLAVFLGETAPGRLRLLSESCGEVLVESLKEPYEDAPLRDELDRLESLRVLASADAWERIRVMRNALAHDYPESAEEKAAALDLAIEMADQMEAVLQRLHDEAGKRRPTP